MVHQAIKENVASIIIPENVTKVQNVKICMYLKHAKFIVNWANVHMKIRVVNTDILLKFVMNGSNVELVGMETAADLAIQFTFGNRIFYGRIHTVIRDILLRTISGQEHTLITINGGTAGNAYTVIL